MKSSFHRFIAVGLTLSGLLGNSGVAWAARPGASDLSAPEKRRVFVERAGSISKPVKPAPLPSDLSLPFNPPGFDLPDGQERATAVAAGQGAPVVQRAVTDRDTLEQIASKIVPSGSMRDKNGEPMLIFPNRIIRRGTHFEVGYLGQQYDLELIRIDSTTFTLRLNREEITRPIKPAKSQ